MEDINHGIRSICSLPETVLEHILSFLPMKDAVRTSVLSKQWEYLWTSIPTLEFIESCYSSGELFMNSIDRMLLLRNRCSIKHFCLDCKIMCGASRINTWVTTVVRRNVQNCNIRLTESLDIIVLPRCLFTCDTLTSLNLDMPCSIRLPSQIHLPNLKVLGLKNVILLDECSIQQLFSSPALEKLYIVDCFWVYLRAISISSPKLKHLTIEEGDAVYANCQVMIRDCNLEHFNLSGSLLNVYSAFNLSAIEVIIWIKGCYDMLDRALLHLKKILQEINAIQKLCFQNRTLYKFDDVPDLTFVQLDFSAFNALHTLQLGYLDLESKALWKLLQCTPHLHTLLVYESIWARKNYKIFDLVPPCFFSSLKKIKVGVLYLVEHELRALKTMLEYAMVLEELVISPERSSKDVGKLKEFRRTLEGYPRGSENCNIIVENSRIKSTSTTSQDLFLSL